MNTVLPSSLSCTLDTQRRNEFWATLALRHCQGLGARTACTLLKQFGSACAVLQALKRPARCASLLADAAFDTNARPQGRAVSCVHDAGSVNRATGMVQQRAPLAPEHGRGISRKVADALSRDDWRISARKEWDKALSLRGVQVLLWTDSDYPALLRELPDAPALLYARGDLSLLRAPAVGVVGTRRSTERGRRDATTLAGNLAAAGICIVSGMARGIDRAAHKAALPLPGGTIAVLGTGIDVIYPAGNADLYAELCANALVLSEFAPETRPEAYNFPARNRIISGLALGVLVIEAAPRSGSLITARYALEQNRTVYAVGGNIGETGSEGCQELIRQGAVPVFSHLDMLRDLQALLTSGQGPSSGPGQIAPAPACSPQPPKPSSAPGTGNAGARRADLGASEPAASAAPFDDPAPAAPGSPSLQARSAPAPTVQKPALAVASPVRQPVSDAIFRPADKEQASARILTELVRHGPLSVDALCERLHLPPAAVSADLVLLEVRGHIRLEPDGRYAAV